MNRGIFIKADEKLLEALERLKKGEQEGFEVLYSQTYNFVYARARHTMQNEQEALDLVKEVYLAAYKNIGSLKNSICLYSWLGSIVVRQGAKMARKNSRMHLAAGEPEHLLKEIEDTSAKVEEAVIVRQNAEQLKKIIELLPEAQKTVIIEYYYDGLKVEQIAELTGSSKGTVTSRLYLARKRLREMIYEMEQKEGFTIYGFNTPLIIWAVGILLEETRMDKKLVHSVYQGVCQSLGIAPRVISMGSAGRSLSMERLVGESVRIKSRMGIRNLLEYIAEAGKMKTAVIAVCTIAAVSLSAALIYRQMENTGEQMQCVPAGAVRVIDQGFPAGRLTGHHEKIVELCQVKITEEPPADETEKLQNKAESMGAPELSEEVPNMPKQPEGSEAPAAEPKQPEPADKEEQTIPPEEQEQPKEPEHLISSQYASDSWSRAEIDALNTIVADWAWGLIDEDEAHAQLIAQLPGRKCTMVYYPAGQYAEMKTLVNSLDQSVYVLSSLLGDNEAGSWFIYGE